MSLVHMDGFDLYASSADLQTVYNIGGGAYINTTGGRFGGGAVVTNNQYVAYSVPGALTEIWFGFAYNCQNPTSYGGVTTVTSNAGVEMTLFYRPLTGQIDVCTNAGDSPVIGTATIAGLASGWHWIEVHFKLSSSSGVVELWVDGVQQVNVTGINTANRGGTSISAVFLGTDYSNNLNALIDDFYILNPTTGSYNTGRLGDSRIETLKPSSDASPNNGTPSTAGSHYAMVDEAQNDGSSSYITITNTSGQEELYGFGSLAATPANVRAVKVSNWCEKTDAGSCFGESVVSSSSTVSNGSSLPLLTGFSNIYNIYESDPHTSAAWTYSAVNSAYAGFRIT